MDSKTLAKFKRILEEERDRVLKGHTAVDETLHIDANEQSDDVDAASSGAEQSFRMRLKSREVLYLKKVEEALLKVSQGDFGTCEECGDDIDVRRLNARPTASLCIACKEDQEKSEKGTMSGIEHKSIGRTWKPS